MRDNILTSINKIDALYDQTASILDLIQCADDTADFRSITVTTDMCVTMLDEIKAEVDKIWNEIQTHDDDLKQKESKMGKLNLESFNKILLGALKDNSPKGQLEMIKAELSMVFEMITAETGDLLDELEEYGYKSERFDRIKTIKKNSELLVIKMLKLEELIKEEEEKQ